MSSRGMGSKRISQAQVLYHSDVIGLAMSLTSTTLRSSLMWGRFPKYVSLVLVYRNLTFKFDLISEKQIGSYRPFHILRSHN